MGKLLLHHLLKYLWTIYLTYLFLLNIRLFGPKVLGEQKNETQEPREGDRSWTEGRPSLVPGGPGIGGIQRPLQTPPDGKFPMQNNSHVKFETPKVPVIFVLGGPGSGKVTHCDNLMQEKKGVVHINMTDLLQQYAIGNDMQDFGTLSSKTVTEVLMLEMKMAPAAKSYLVSGYPRSMRDVAEYSDKIQVVNGVILVSWRQKVLERQIEYGARLGHVVLSLARMELNNFYKNVMPVADYFDQSNMLVAVNGERNPGEVYKDFRAAVLKVLGSQEDPSAMANGITGAGPSGIPGEIVGVDPAPPIPTTTFKPPAQPIVMPNVVPVTNNIPRVDSTQHVVQADVITVRAADMEPTYQSPVKPGLVPPVIWVIGGPGSNKSALCMRAAQQIKGWAHFSVGRSLRQIAEAADLKSGTDGSVARQSISGGEMVPQAIVMKLIQDKLREYSKAAGIIMDGFPRDIDQAKVFEQMYQQKPRVVLLDCSKLQLGRGRLDDSVAAFRRRLELFRELSLPMLKALDTEQRLIIVDGDTDTEPVQQDFDRIMHQFMLSPTSHESQNGNGASIASPVGAMPLPAVGETAGGGRQAFQGIRTISEHVQNSTQNISNGINHMANGAIKNGVGIANGYLNGVVANGLGGMANGIPGIASSKVAPIQAHVNNVRNMPAGYGNIDSHI